MCVVARAVCREWTNVASEFIQSRPLVVTDFLEGRDVGEKSRWLPRYCPKSALVEGDREDIGSVKGSDFFQLPNAGWTNRWTGSGRDGP